MHIGRGGVEGDLHAVGGSHAGGSPSTPVGGGLEAELARPREAFEVASMPTIHTGSSTGLRFEPEQSVPMLPGPISAII